MPDGDELLLEQIVRAALFEDIGRGGDVTTDSIIGAEVVTRAAIVSRKAGVVAGHAAARLTFRMLDPNVRYEILAPDGATIQEGTAIARVSGPARAILTGERTALNFLGHLSGIATAAHALVERAAAYRAQIVCTRKTTPGLRLLEREAVVAGGTSLHRYGLDDA
ncbi:MAG: nicotinate-nucleotide diphosphorylase (carboxylating), partial [Candidatus Eremiobacteraeota bacterium]|nr:nicotinate-nucleotide diphosphorylase (carboxylating) [Candidatus Eremiobacteraeota bacterium]